jgi:LysM repeat protein
MTIKNTIDSYRKRRNQMLPLVLAGVVILLVTIGIILLVSSMSGGGFRLFSSKTFTPSISPTITDTLPPSETPTITPTPTETPTNTASAPHPYIVAEGDTLTSIVEAQNLGENGIVLILLLNPYTPSDEQNPGIDPVTAEIRVGQVITIPPPNYPVPTATPWPSNAVPGTRISYFVLPGDSLGLIAAKLNSTVAQIVNANRTLLVDGENSIIYPGWILIVPVNLVTPIPSPTPTGPTATGTPTFTPTLTASPTP